MIVQPRIIGSEEPMRSFPGSFFITATIAAARRSYSHYVLLTRLKTDGSMKGMLTSPDEVRRFL